MPRVNQYDEEQASQEFLSELGLAVFNAQALEYGMTSLFAASHLQQGERAGELLRQLMNTRYAQTLGRLVNDAVRHLKLSDALATTLRGALHGRNWLVHHFYRERAPAAFDIDLKRSTTVRLREVREQIETACDLVHEEVMRRLTAAGFEPQRLEERAR